MLCGVVDAKAVLCKVADAKVMLCEVADTKAMLYDDAMRSGRCQSDVMQSLSGRCHRSGDREGSRDSYARYPLPKVSCPKVSICGWTVKRPRLQNAVSGGCSDVRWQG